MSAAECKVCGTQHDPQIHQAVLAVRAWLRRRVLGVLEPPPRPRLTQPPHPNQFYVRGSGRP
jgi:hypothetical protein